MSLVPVPPLQNSALDIRETGEAVVPRPQDLEDKREAVSLKARFLNAGRLIQTTAWRGGLKGLALPGRH